MRPSASCGVKCLRGTIAAGREFARAAIEAEQAEARLNLVIKATGNAARLTREQLDGMTDAMAELTQFDDEALRNAQAQLMKFGNIAGESFRGAMKAAADLADTLGRTPLHYAALCNSLDCVRTLVEAGCDASRADAEGATARDLASAEGNREVVKALEARPH